MGQVFALHDIFVVLVLIGLEALLSVDNCVVLTVMVQHLPDRTRRKALLYGIGGAFLFRLVFVLLATTMMRYWWIQALGAAYLFYITLKHFRSSPESTLHMQKRTLLQTIVAVELTDVCFAGDSVMAGVALVKAAPEKLWSVYLGGILGILLLRLTISVLGRVVDRWPRLIDVGYCFVSWVGMRLLLVAMERLFQEKGSPLLIASMPDSVFWGGMATIATLGTIYVAKGRVQPDYPGTSDAISLQSPD